MDLSTYEGLRQFADSWGLVYMFAIFAVVAVMLFLRGAKQRAVEAAYIPLADDDQPLSRSDRK
jgi:cytochrome c oxidase cbb3-type subunit 4